MSRGDVLLYTVLPYAALAAFAVGTCGGSRGDQKGGGAGTTRIK